ncbi:MAG: hypothetical protein ACO3X3_01635, partial [Burkholderiaceae bacterium]
MRPNRLLGGALLLAALSGCATVPMSESGAPVVDATVIGGQAPSMPAVASPSAPAAEVAAAAPVPG